MRTFVVDTDLNFPSDDFQALMLMLSANNITVEGVFATAGNTWSEEAYLNVKYALSACHLENPCPVYLGGGAVWNESSVKWARDLLAKGKRSFIGAIGKSDAPRLVPETLRKVCATSARIGCFTERIRNAHEKLEVLCLAPVTNIAHLLRAFPDFQLKVERLIMMGGRLPATSNPSQPADFNFWYDADAAREVLTSGVETLLVPYEVCRQAQIDDCLTDAIRKASGPASRMFMDDFFALSRRHGADMPLWDQLTALIAIEPRIVTESVRVRMRVRTEYDDWRGHCVTEPDTSGTIELVCAVDRNLVHETLVQCLENMSLQMNGMPNFHDGIANWDDGNRPFSAVYCSKFG